MKKACACCQVRPKLDDPDELLCVQCSIDLDIWIVEVTSGDEEPA